MDNNMLKKLCGQIDYNTYKKIQNSFRYLIYGMVIANNSVLSQYPTLNNYGVVLLYLFAAAHFGLAWSGYEKYTKDILEIRNLYQDFITNYNKLNRTFSLTNPIQIHTMFSYLLGEGYLSADKNFEFDSKESRDITGLQGMNVIAGNAVCRHIAAMLTDILNNYGIESNQLGVFLPGYRLEIKKLDHQKYTKEDLVNWAQTHIEDEEVYNIAMKFIKLAYEKELCIEMSMEIVKDKSILKKIFGNHAITFSVMDGKSYYLDPTNERIYRLMENEKNILYSDDKHPKVRITLASITELNGNKDYLQIQKKLQHQYPSETIEEERRMVTQTIATCKNNMDIFDQFYSENSDLYREISSKVLRIKK